MADKVLINCRRGSGLRAHDRGESSSPGATLDRGLEVALLLTKEPSLSTPAEYWTTYAD